MWVFWEDGAPQHPLVLLPSTEAHLEVSGGMLGLEFLQEAETLENREPNQRIRHSHPQLLVFVTEPSNHQVAGKYLFLCQRCVISLREIVPSKLSEPLSYRWGVNRHWSKGRINCKAIVNPQVEEFSFHRCKSNSRKKLLNLYSVYGRKNLTQCLQFLD